MEQVVVSKNFFSIASILLFGVLFFIPQELLAANLYWVGANGGSLHSADNWSDVEGSACETNGGASVPTKDDVIFFTSNCVNNASSGASEFSVKGVRIEEGYTGTISYTHSNTAIGVGSEGYMQSDGVFSVPSTTASHLVVNGDFTLQGGTFNSVRRLVVTGEFKFTGGDFNYNEIEVEGMESVSLIASQNSVLNNLPNFGNLFLSDGLVGYWKFDEGEGTSVADSSGGGLTGTLVNGPTWINDTPNTNFKNTNALQFTASNSTHVFLEGNLEASRFNVQVGDMTIAAWVKKTDLANSGVIFGRDQDGNRNLYYLRANSDGSYHFRMRGSDLNSVVITSDIHPADEWLHIAGVKTADEMTLYINGVVEATGEPPAIFGVGSGGNNLCVGARNCVTSPKNLFTGLIDEPRIYNRALSPEEIAALAAGSEYATGSTLALTNTLSSNINASGNLTLSHVVFNLNSYNLTLGETSVFSNAGTLKLQGGETLTNFTNDADKGVVEYTGSGTYNSLIAGNSYYDVKFSGTGHWKASDNVTVNNNLSILKGIFSLNGYNLTLGETSLFSNDGTFRLHGSETLTNFVNDTDSGTVEYTGSGTYNSLIAGNNYYDLKFNGTGHWKASSNTTVNRNFNLQNGTFTAPSILNVVRNFTNFSTFNHNDGTVKLTGTNQSLSGITSFYNLTKVTPGTLTFPANNISTFYGTLTLKGTVSQDLNLRSSVSGEPFYINPLKNRVIERLSVRDSNNINSNLITCTNCKNLGNNTGWVFPAVLTPVPLIQQGAMPHINSIFRQVYGRAPTYNEWLYWANRVAGNPLFTPVKLLGAMQYHALNNQTTPVSTVSLPTNLNHPLIRSINQQFRQTYNRFPSKEEWEYWTNKALKGEYQTSEQMLGAMQYQRQFYANSPQAISVSQKNLMVPHINSVYRSVFVSNPNVNQWQYWYSRIIRGEKRTLDSLLGAMEWVRSFGSR